MNQTEENRKSARTAKSDLQEILSKYTSKIGEYKSARSISTDWHWQDLLTDILKFVMEKLIDRSEISLGKFLPLFEVDDGCWTEIMMIRQTFNGSCRIPVNGTVFDLSYQW